MRLCLYRHPTLTPDVPRLGLVRDEDIVDVHGVCLTSLLGYMRPKRATEIAEALCPPDLVSFLDGGRHAWNALRDSIARLGPRLDIAPPTMPEGDDVVVAKTDVRLVPLVPSGAGWATAGFGSWQTMPVPSPGSGVIVALHTDARAYLPEYLAVVGATIESTDDALTEEAIALVSVIRPSRPESPCLLLTADEAEVEEPGLIDAITRAMAAAAANRTLLVGDVIRCGPPVVAPRRATVDLRDSVTMPVPVAAAARVDLDLTDDIVPTS